MSAPTRDLHKTEVAILRAALPIADSGSWSRDNAPHTQIRRQTMGLRRAELVELIQSMAWLNGRLLKRLEQVEPGTIDTILEQLEDPQAAMRKLLAGD